MTASKKVVLAYSGGLDTSFCLKYLQQEGYEVHTILVNTGGFSPEELDQWDPLESTCRHASLSIL